MWFHFYWGSPLLLWYMSWSSVQNLIGKTVSVWTDGAAAVIGSSKCFIGRVKACEETIQTIHWFQKETLVENTLRAALSEVPLDVMFWISQQRDYPIASIGPLFSTIIIPPFSATYLFEQSFCLTYIKNKYREHLRVADQGLHVYHTTILTKMGQMCAISKAQVGFHWF